MANECKDWKGQLQDIINRHNDRHAVKPKCVSHKTMHERAIFLFAFFSELRKNGVRNFKIPPSNLGGRHVSFMVKRWLERDLVARHYPGLSEPPARFRELDWQGRHGPRTHRICRRSCSRQARVRGENGQELVSEGHR